MLVELFHWPLSQIDVTDMESLIPFVFRYPKWKTKQGKTSRNQRVYADQAEWL